MSFDSVHNYQERAVFELVLSRARDYPALAMNSGLLADVACVALNRIPPRYIRHDMDMTFFADVAELERLRVAAHSAVEIAFDFVCSRIDGGDPR